MPDIQVTNIPPIVDIVAAAGDASYTLYPFRFAVLNPTEIEVYVTPIGSAANDSTQKLTYGVAYTVTINPAPGLGGTVRLTNALNIGDRITIKRTTAEERTSIYADGNLLSASTLNSDFNSVVMMAQENNLYNKKLCPHYNITEKTDSNDYILPRLLPGTVWTKNALGKIINAAPGTVVGVGVEPVGTITAGTLPVFADAAGRVKSTGITVDENNNVAGINRLSMLPDGFIEVRDIEAANSITSTNFGGDTVNVNDVTTENLTVNGATTLTNVIINGTVSMPNFEPFSLTAQQNVSAPLIQALAMLQTPAISSPVANGTITISNSISCRGMNAGGFSVHSYNFNATYGHGQSLQIGGVAVDTINTLYTTTDNHSIGISPANGGAVQIFNQTGNIATTLQMYDGTGNVYVGIKVPNAMNANPSYTMTLPPNKGAANNVLATDGNGNLSWVVPTYSAPPRAFGIISFPDRPDGLVTIKGQIGMNAQWFAGYGVAATKQNAFGLTITLNPAFPNTNYMVKATMAKIFDPQGRPISTDSFTYAIDHDTKSTAAFRIIFYLVGNIQAMVNTLSLWNRLNMVYIECT
jgi:hypothetical protein